MKTIYTLSLLLLSFTGRTQPTAGIIHFEEKHQLNIQVDDNEMAAGMLPKEQLSRKILFFNSEYSLYKSDSIDSSPTEFEQSTDNGTVKIKMDKPDEQSYYDLNSKTLTEQRDFMMRKFLVTNDLSKTSWKINDNQKIIAGYNCQSATRQEGDRKITAWFTGMIPVSSGPSRFMGLPGMVLGVDINDGQLQITATQIDFREINAKTLLKPKEGKKVTWEEFEKIRAEKQKEMQEENGGDGNVIIKIRK